MDLLKRYLAAVELMKRTREAVGAQCDIVSDAPQHRLVNGALALAEAELAEARESLLEYIQMEGLPALEIDPARVGSGKSVVSLESWLQEEANQTKRQVVLRWGEETFVKSPTTAASGSVAFSIL